MSERAAPTPVSAAHAVASDPASGTRMDLVRPPCRVGIMLDSFTVEAWCASIIRHVLAAPHLELCVIVLNDADPYPPPRNLFDKLSRVRGSLLYLLYDRYERRRFATANDPFALVDVGDWLAGVPVMRVKPRMTQYSDFFPESDVAALRRLQLDVALRFGFRILRGDALRIARYGVWSYHHADNRVNRGGPPGFWEVFNAEPVTGSILQILNEDLDGGQVIYRSYAATEPTSVYRNRCRYYATSTAFVPRMLRRLYEAGPTVLAPCEARDIPVYERPLYRAPRNSEMLRFGGRLAARNVHRRLTALLTREQWALAYRFLPAGAPPGIPDATFYKFKIIRPPADRFWADPFPLEHEGRYFIFYEEYLHAEQRGRIGVLEVDPKTGPGAPQVALERPHHLSFPHVFVHDGEIYMVPETEAARRIELYRCTRVPNQWVLEQVLLEDIRAVDPVLFRAQDRWWMFASVRENGAPTWDEVSLFYANDLRGPWTPHPNNPVRSDVRSSRPAGRVFQRDGVLYRPAQDGSIRYGYGMAIHRIDYLGTDDYRESEAARIAPRWDPEVIGTHTLNAAGRLTVTDVLLRRGRWKR